MREKLGVTVPTKESEKRMVGDFKTHMSLSKYPT